MKLLAKTYYGYQIVHRSRLSVRKYLSDGNTHAAVNNRLFKKLDRVNNALSAVELTKAQIKHKEPTIIAFLILQYAKFRKFELYCKFFIKVCDLKKLEELEIDTCFLYLALAEKELEDCIQPEMKAE